MKKLLALCLILSSPVFASEDVKEEKKERSLRFGPSLEIVSAPHPLNAGIEFVYNDFIGFSIHKSFLPEFEISEVAIKLDSSDVRARVFPFKGSFFVGLGYGSQRIRANKTSTFNELGQDYKLDGSATVNSSTLTPHIGWRWVTKSGFMMGMDFGWQMSLSSHAKVNIKTEPTYAGIIEDNEDYRRVKDDVEDIANSIGEMGLPNITLLHVGWLF